MKGNYKKIIPFLHKEITPPVQGRAVCQQHFWSFVWSFVYYLFIYYCNILLYSQKLRVVYKGSKVAY